MLELSNWLSFLDQVCRLLWEFRLDEATGFVKRNPNINWSGLLKERIVNVCRQLSTRTLSIVQARLMVNWIQCRINN